MKVLTVNFLTCAVKACKPQPQAYPLHFKDAELQQTDATNFSADFVRNVLPRIDWTALKTTASELGFHLPDEKPEGTDLDEHLAKDIHRLLLETEVVEGKLVCGNCGHEYNIKEGIANFLLPSHLV